MREFFADDRARKRIPRADEVPAISGSIIADRATVRL
jgi:hypothetical protein